MTTLTPVTYTSPSGQRSRGMFLRALGNGLAEVADKRSGRRYWTRIETVRPRGRVA